ncbi:MAG: hypothetical protein GX607_22280 [Myxococcales bacterium]|jgi:hypothetical protein|nr:hypothetical protein [Myxococcales bacterium]
MQRRIVYVVLGLVSGVMGCATQGSGSGELESGGTVGGARGEAPVRFSWHSQGASVTRGDISATVPGRGPFQGTYMQVTSDIEESDVEPYFADDWYDGWDEWDGWGPGGDAFVTTYSGKVIAVLRSEQGERMRCRFDLAEPDRGPAGGGMGECQLSDGAKIEDVVLEGS